MNFNRIDVDIEKIKPVKMTGLIREFKSDIGKGKILTILQVIIEQDYSSLNLNFDDETQLLDFCLQHNIEINDQRLIKNKE